MEHLTPEQKQYVLRRYREGASLRGIGREIGRPDITVRRTLIALGVDFGAPRTSNKRSSPETEGLVLRLYDEGHTWREINEQAGITSVTLAKILTRNGREFSRRSDAEANAEVIGSLYETGSSTRDISRILGHSKSTVNAAIVRHGGKLRQVLGCEYPDFFEQVDTPEKAYWLGFISADGCVVSTEKYPEGSHLAVQLGIQDKDHLLKLREALGAHAGVRTGTHPASQGGRLKARGYASLAVGSRRLTKSLIALGVTPRKSATVQPWGGPADLMPHYWRGLFDGDGSLAKKTAGQYQAFLCGSEACVREFTGWAHGICGTTAKPYFRTGCWYVSISGRHQVPKLVRAMYADAPVSLDRKQARANSILAPTTTE
jgi:transposase-like protein